MFHTNLYTASLKSIYFRWKIFSGRKTKFLGETAQRIQLIHMCLQGNIKAFAINPY